MTTIPPQSAMNESSEFTFLPPLQEARHLQQQQQQQQHSRTNSQQNLHHSAGSSTGSLDNPVRQVQVPFIPTIQLQ
jgi:hypothetical protein